MHLSELSREEQFVIEMVRRFDVADDLARLIRSRGDDLSDSIFPHIIKLLVEARGAEARAEIREALRIPNNIPADHFVVTN